MLHSTIRRLNEKCSNPSCVLLDPGSADVGTDYQNVCLLPSSLRRSWELQRPLWHRFDRWVPGAVDYFSTTWPTLTDWLSRAKTLTAGADGGKSREFLRRLASAEVLIVSGGGFVTDLFNAAERVLNLLLLAHSRDVPVFMFGQGIGPIRSSRIRNKARRALPRVRSIALREKKFSYSILRDLGVSDDRITVTGDDSVAFAHGMRPQTIGNRIGVNVRIAYYSEVSESVRESVAGVLSEIAGAHGASLTPIPIAHKGEDSDVRHIRSIIATAGGDSDGGRSLQSPEEIIHQAGKCRVVVTGSYHGGVFALSQGVPVVGLARSKYYRNKFHGLADMFGVGCTVLRTDQADFGEELREAVRRAWKRAPEVRPQLLRAAKRQIDAADAAYDEMVASLNSTATN